MAWVVKDILTGRTKDIFIVPASASSGVIKTAVCTVLSVGSNL